MKNNLIISFICFCVVAYSQSNLINGVFIVNQGNYLDSTYRLTVNNTVAAYFTYAPSSAIQPGNFDSAGSINFRDSAISYNSTDKFYTKTNVYSLDSMIWSVGGAGSIPAMNFLYSGALPRFTFNSNTITDTLKKADTLFITLNGIQNADSVMISFADDAQLQTQHHCAFMAPNYSNTYYIVPSVYSSLTIGPRAYIKIDVINYSYQTISNKQYLFRNIFSFAKGNIEITN